MKLKYIIVRDNHGNPRENGPERAILFDKDLVHKDVARVHRVGGLVVISAGFVDINGYDVRVYGHSESLGMSSRPDDLYVVNQALLGDDYRGFDDLHRKLDDLNFLINGMTSGKIDADAGLADVLVPIRNFFESLLPPKSLVKQD